MQQKLFAFLIITLFSSVSLHAKLENIPYNLKKSLLIVELYPVDYSKEIRKSRPLMRFTDIDSWNHHYNDNVRKKMKEYPYDYVCTQPDSIGDLIADTTRTIYILRNGDVSSSGSLGSNEQTQVVIVNVSKGTKRTVCWVNEGITNMISRFIKQVEKQ